jgi:hypothetical protein
LNVGEFSSILASLLGFLPSLDQPIRSGEHLRRDRQADLLSRFQIDDELELLRLLAGEIGWLGTFKGDALKDSARSGSVGHKTPLATKSP